ncbi:hypothetical protein [Methanobrevibacter smithii]|uniref:hypothetical protein n=1 Tax=Methanobrevibacter smithii TaxID=2173 RepID=UPI0037DD9C4A
MMSTNKSNHFYIDESNVDFFKSSVILNSNRTGGIIQRENFVLLAAYGFYTGYKTNFLESKNKGLDSFVMNQLTDDELAILYAIAIADSEDVEIVNDDVGVANIAMEYANTGINVLRDLEKKSQLNNEIKKFQIEIQDAIEESLSSN